MQTVLRPIKVRNPFAELLKLPECVFKPLRTNAHYLAVIETITLPPVPTGNKDRPGNKRKVHRNHFGRC